jgi:Wadjet anti plasmid transformation system JetA-like protein
MIQFSNALFREITGDFFRVLASPLASLYVDVLDALEREAAQRMQGVDRDDAIALVQHIVEQHSETGDLGEESATNSASPNGKARVVLETLRRAGWVHEEERSNWERVVYFEPHGAILLQALRKIASPEAVVFSDKLVSVCVILTNRAALTEDLWPQIESCIANLQMGLAELRGMQSSIERHTRKQLAATTLKENLAVLFDQFAQQIGHACYAQLVQARLPSKLAGARRTLDEIENDLDLLWKMQAEVIRRAPALSAETALAQVRIRLNELHELLDMIEPLADAIDRRTADFARRSQARFRYLQETATENRGKVQLFFETINKHFAGLRMPDIDISTFTFPRLLLHDVRLPSGIDSLYTPRLRRSLGDIEPVDDIDPSEHDRAVAQLEGNIRDSLTVNRANRFVRSLPGGRGTTWNSADLLREHVRNDEDMADVIACLLHSRSNDAEYDISVSRAEAEADIGAFDSKLRYSVERFLLMKK